MASVNKVMLVGNLGRDPEVRHTASGAMVATLNLATTDKFKDRNGNLQEQTEWHRVVIFGKTAEIAEAYLRKGSQVYVEGRLQTRKWQDQSGQARYTTEIVCDRMQMLGKGADVEKRQAPVPSAAMPEDDWDIPFDPSGSDAHSSGFDDPPF